jgi:hypothetical protein
MGNVTYDWAWFSDEFEGRLESGERLVVRRQMTYQRTHMLAQGVQFTWNLNLQEFHDRDANELEPVDFPAGEFQRVVRSQVYKTQQVFIRPPPVQPPHRLTTEELEERSATFADPPPPPSSRIIRPQ